MTRRRAQPAARAAPTRDARRPRSSVRFGDLGIDLELGVWVRDPEKGQADVRSDVNRAIWKAFQEAGIGVPVKAQAVRVLRRRAGDDPPSAGEQTPPSRRLRPTPCRTGKAAAGGRRTRSSLYPASRRQLAYNAQLPLQHGRPPPLLMRKSMTYDWLGRGLARADRPAVVGLRRRRAGADPRHDRLGHDLPAPQPGAPRAGPASGGRRTSSASGCG